MDVNDAQFVLHRYFLAPDQMRSEFRKTLWEHGPHPEITVRGMHQKVLMQLWHMSLYVVIEAWQKLGLTDPTVDELLTSPNRDLLRQHRNAVAHFQPEYQSAKEIGVLVEESAQQWIEDVHRAIGRYLDDWLRATAPFELPTGPATGIEEMDERLAAWFAEKSAELDET